MGDMGDVGRALKQASKHRRARNRAAGAAYLEREGIKFTTHNMGAHLIIVSTPTGVSVWDYWPGTGKWKERKQTKYRRGVAKLVKDIRRREEKQK